MQVELETEGMYFGIEINILNYGTYVPAKLTGNPDSWHDDESEPHEWEVESVESEFTDATFGDYLSLNEDDKDYYTELYLKGKELLNHYFTSEEECKLDELVEEAVNEEFG